MKLVGKAWKYGANVDTDVIIPARYLTEFRAEELAKHCMEDLDPTFAKEVQPGDIIVAGRSFGIGSSREHAPGVHQGLGHRRGGGALLRAGSSTGTPSTWGCRRWSARGSTRTWRRATRWRWT